MRRMLLLGSVLAPAALAGGARAPVTYVSEPVLEQLSASSLAVAPDGRNPYVLGGLDLSLTRDGRLFVGDQDSIGVYSLRANGALVAGACVSAASVAGCTRLPARVRRGSLGRLVVSPDGRWLYSADDRVLAFRVPG